jgi:prepilin-type N-terminal cleavage/methylation domain-containing protein
MRRKAFTLVELLVVIAIIALLIAILAPSLKSAKDLAKNAICMTHLRAVGSASVLYAAANQERLPPFRDSYTRPLSPIHLATVYGMSTGVPFVDANGEPELFGTWSYLLKSGVLTPDTIYCPSQQTGQWRRSTYPAPYGVKSPEGDPSQNFYCCSYMFNTPLRITSGEGFWEHTRVSDFPSEKILSMDIFIRWWDCWHGSSWDTFSENQSATWMVVHPDTHVTQKSSLKAWKYMIELDGWYGDAVTFTQGLKYLLEGP